MNSLLIYNANVPLSLKYDFEEQLGVAVLFRIFKDEMLAPLFSMDKKMSDFLLSSEIEIKEYDVIFIPYSLSDDNYIAFLGLRLAHHIRMTKDFKNIQTPIVFFGFDSGWEINKLTKLGQILHTRNIFSTDNISIGAFKAQTEYILKNIGKGSMTVAAFIKDFISKLPIDPPGNYYPYI